MNRSPEDSKAILEIIEKVDNLFDSEQKWTKGWYAKDSLGIKCLESDPKATCHCLIGGIIKVSPDPQYSNLASPAGNGAIWYLNALAQGDDPSRTKGAIHLPGALSDWNDDPDTTFQDVKNLLNLAKKALCNAPAVV